MEMTANKRYTHEEEMALVCDARQDILCALNHMTDSQTSKACDVEKLATAYAKMAHAGGMTSTESYTGLHRAAHMVMSELDHMPAEWTPHLHQKDGLDAIINMQAEHLKTTLMTGNYQERIAAYKKLGAAVVYALERMTCDS